MVTNSESHTTISDENWDFDSKIDSLELQTAKPNQYELKTSSISHPSLNDTLEFYGYNKAVHPFSFPLYVLTTKDCFAFDLVEKISVIDMLGRRITKTGNPMLIVIKFV